jgi:CRP-like cAMP-binding protein
VGIENEDRIFYSRVDISSAFATGRKNVMFVTKEYRKGKKIVRQGTHGTSAFLIKKGTVEVYREDVEGNKVVLATLKENDLFGEMAMISSDERSASVIALEDCEVAVLTREKFLTLPDSSPAVVRLKTIMKERLKSK